ncbi:MAG: EamA family transporter [Hyphomicrobiales bacterium]|nr:EamA family transporter [Hyphomicrobiales bacterium]
MSRPAATLAGSAAIAMWSLLALFTAASGAVPPFQLSALCFSIGAAIGFIWLAASGRWRDLRQPLPVWALGVAGLFGYHALYFTALRNAPPVEAGLIAYLWPLLIVVFSALLPEERLRWHHLAGAVLGLAGTVLIVSGGGGLAFESDYAGGYLAALGCALVWSTYSVVSRRFADVPSAIVAGFCLAAAVLSVPAHLAFETTLWPQTAGQWLAVAGLGLMPVGAAFYVWDIGVKHGEIQLLGVLSYGAPLLSTLVLIVAGYGVFSLKIGVAALLITAGALLASRQIMGRRPG